MKRFTQLFSILFLFLMIGCQQSGYENQGISDTKADPSSPPNYKEDDKKTKKVSPRKLIKEGQVSFQTDNMDQAREAILKATDQFQGYISSDQSYNRADRVSNTITVRIPTKHFETFLSTATVGVEAFENKTISAKDVTEEFVDIQARLKAKKALEDRLLGLLPQAHSIDEILQVEQQAGDLRSDIEAIEGRLRYLESKISFSTLTLTFYKEYDSPVWSQFKSSFINGWDNLVKLFIALTNLWPFMLLGIAAFFGVRIYKRRG